MKNNAKKIISVVLSMVIMLTCLLTATSCSGFIIKPQSDGSITVTPNPENDPESAVYYKGIGDAVNLLTGTYTDFASGTTRIWNETEFAKLRADDRTSVHGYQKAEVVYSESLDGYLDQLTQSIGNKTSVNASVGYAGIVKVTAGYSYDVSKNYERKTQAETKTVFYDLDYKYIDKSVEIYGYNDKSKLSAIISDDFKADADALQSGRMTPVDFIAKYGTHIVTAGTYGAKFNLHYEVLTDTVTAEATFGENIQQSINAGIQGTLYGVQLGLEVGNTTSVDKSEFTSKSNSNMQTKFTATAIGGNATGMMATSLDQFSKICENWASGLAESDKYVLIDVPDGSLFFVWDFLGYEYSEAKTMLYNYFYSVCDEQYTALRSKISSIYSDSYAFNEEDGTLTVNLSCLQTYEKADLGNLYYEQNGKIVYDNTTNEFIVYSRYNGNDIKKVVFIGKYGTKDLEGMLIQNIFNPFSIKFDEWWDSDIVIEFVNFAYEAPNGKCALDFSQVKSENITIIVDGNAYIKGGNDMPCINAEGKNLTIDGDGNFVVKGGNGANATSSKVSGFDGGIGIIAENLIIDMDAAGTLNITGGVGGNGANGENGKKGNPSFNGHSDRDDAGDDGIDGGNGTAGGNGSNAGKGGYAYSVTTLTMNGGSLIATGGQSGNGGNGGNGGAGGQGQEVGGWWHTAGDGGNGGNGGNGGDTYIVAASNSSEIIVENGGVLSLVDGAAGTAGNAGSGGAAGAKGVHCSGDHCNQGFTWGDDGNDGTPGSAGKAGAVVDIT